MYDPTQVREDLKINARPISMLTKFVKNGDSIQPYNGSWMQVPVVRDGAEFTPVVRMPDAVILNMTVSVKNASLTEVTLTIRNKGSATINSQTPITFYNGGTSGNPIGNIQRIETQSTGVDIFPDETVTRTYSLNGNYNDMLIWARITDDGTLFPAAGYLECNLSDNTFAGSDCQLFSAAITASSNTILCGDGSVTLSVATSNCSGTETKTYQWYYYDDIIDGATSSTYNAAIEGKYRCYVTCGPVCRAFSSPFTVTRSNMPAAEIEGNPVLRYDASTDSLHIAVKVQNSNIADFNAPFKVTVYKNGKGNAMKYIHSYQSAIEAGETVEISFGISDFKTAWYDNSYTGLFLNINDNGNTYNDRSVCDSANRSAVIGQIIAVDDHVTVLCNSKNNRISVGANDFLYCPSANATVTVDRITANGKCDIDGDALIYTPQTGYTGLDTVTYTIICNGNTSAANVYIAVQNRPDITGDVNRVVCSGSSQDIVGTYKADCSVSDSVIYRWEFRPVKSSSWQTFEPDTVVLDCSTNPANITIERKISSISKSDEGYYRIWVNYPSSAGYGAVSDSVYLQVMQDVKVPDIRIDISASPSRTVRLTGFLDTIDNAAVAWTKVTPFAPDINTVTGEINTSGLSPKRTYTYRYSMTSACVSTSAIAYVYVLNDKLIRRLDTVAICKDHIQSKSINLNQILGSELDGKWKYDNTVNYDNTVSDNVKTFPVSSNYHGALIFNGYQAWHNAADTHYKINYRGDTEAKAFKFAYTSAAESCIGEKEKTFVIVITGN
jgi:hypothetical protein